MTMFFLGNEYVKLQRNTLDKVACINNLTYKFQLDLISVGYAILLLNVEI